MSKGWTEERRQKQRENIQKHRPWEKSTGPCTEEGKAISSQNSLRPDAAGEIFRQLNQILQLSDPAFPKYLREHVRMSIKEDIRNKTLEKRIKSDKHTSVFTPTN